MKIFSYIIIAILFINIAEARVIEKEIEFTARNLKGRNSIDTTINIMNFVNTNITYEFFYSTRSPTAIWLSRKGDCTDRAELMNIMLEINKIESRKVHGWCEKYKHDWLEVKINGKWVSYLNYECEKKGTGFW